MRKTVIALTTGLAIVTRRRSATGSQPYTPGLVEFMLQVQSHHAKLWLAGNARNWDLADYQVDELKELLEDIAKRVPKYKGTPVGQMIETTTMPPIGDIEGAIKARDCKFTAAFDKLTVACNACHEAANRCFIVIQRPALAVPKPVIRPAEKIAASR